MSEFSMDDFRRREALNKKNKGKTPWFSIWAAAAMTVNAGVQVSQYLERSEYESTLEETADRPELLTIDEQYENHPGIAEDRAYLRETYGITVRFGGDPEYDGFTSQSLTVEQARTSLQYLRASLERYPAGFFARTGVPEIRIGRDLQVIDHPFFPGQEQEAISGLTMPDRNEILLELSVDSGFARFMSTFDHELYHWLDARRPNRSRNDAEWVAMHQACECRPYSNYVNGEVVSAPGSERTNLGIWFFDTYGSRTPMEDKATMANVIFSPADHLQFLQRLEDIRDVMGDQEAYESLRARYDAVREDYRVWSGGVMDDAYWERLLAEARRTEIRYEETNWSDYYDSTFTDYSYADEQAPLEGGTEDLTGGEAPVQ